MTAAAPPAIVCSVLGESRGRSTVIRGRIVSPDATSGTYRLTVAKTGPSGTSQVAQGGAFSSQAGEAVLVGTLSLSVEPGAQVEARLHVTADGRSFTCTPYTGERI